MHQKNYRYLENDLDAIYLDLLDIEYLNLLISIDPENNIIASCATVNRYFSKEKMGCIFPEIEQSVETWQNCMAPDTRNCLNITRFWQHSPVATPTPELRSSCNRRSIT